MRGGLGKRRIAFAFSGTVEHIENAANHAPECDTEISEHGDTWRDALIQVAEPREHIVEELFTRPEPAGRDGQRGDGLDDRQRGV